MTLQEAIQNFESDRQIYLGAKNAYFYIGTVSELIENASAIDERLREDIRKSFDNALRDIRIDVSMKEKIKWNTTDAKRNVILQGIIDRFHYDVIRKSEAMRQAKKDYDNFVPIMQRTVKDMYEKILKGAEGGTSIIVAGNEHGNFWFKREYDLWKATNLVPVDDTDETVEEEAE